MKDFKIVLIFICTIIIVSSCKEEIADIDLEINVTENSECKNNFKTEANDSLSIIEYSYNEETKVLEFSHINTDMNCCLDEIRCDIDFSDDTIYITELEINPTCDCICPYDYAASVTNLPKGVYIMSFNEPHINSNNEIEFELNLIDSPSGSYTVVRPH
jgi:hypothetical protein